MIVVDRQQELADWIGQKTNGIYSPITGRFIGLELNGKLSAVTAFTDYNGSSIQMHVAIDHRINKEYTQFCFRYPFNQLSVKKVIGLVESNNAKALRFDKHLGFVEEYVVKDAGRHGDIHILSMTREQCRFL